MLLLLFFWACEVFCFFFSGVSFFGGEFCGSAGVALVSFGFFSLCCVALQKSVAEEAEKREREREEKKTELAAFCCCFCSFRSCSSRGVES